MTERKRMRAEDSKDALRERIAELQKENAALKALVSEGDADSALAYMVNGADTLLQAAKFIVELRDNTAREPENTED